MPIRYEIETSRMLNEYGEVPIAFTANSKMVAEPLNGGHSGWELREVAIESPFVKDYDDGVPPTRWLCFDTSNWRIISAFDGQERVGGAVIAWKTPELDFLEGSDDVAALWNIRVAPVWRGQGVGTALFEHVVRYAKSLGCTELKIETQDVNVGACRFYAK